MATKDFLLPDLGEGLTEGEIVAWLVAVGDTVAIDQPVAEIETAKAVVEVPSPFAGIVATLHGEVGEEVQVGTPLLTVQVDAAAPAAEPAEADPAQGSVEPKGIPGHASKDAQVGEAIPQPAESVDEGSGSVLVGYGTTGGSVSRRRRANNGAGTGAAAAPTAPPSRPQRQGKPQAKPPVRKLARDRGIDLAMVEGTGPDGVITRDDVLAFAPGNGNGNGAAAPAIVPPAEDYQQLLQPEPAPAAAPALAAPSIPTAISGERRIPVRGIRKAISAKMTMSRREIPEATTWVDCDATGLWEVREALNSEQLGSAPKGSGEAVRVSPLALILRVVVAGLRKFPEVNASLDTTTNEIVLHDHVNLGFAADTPRGLIVPVIKSADRMSTLEIARELKRLAGAARDGKVTPDELTGGTFTVSNYGSFGVDGGSAVINHPEAAILGTGRIIDRPWVVGGEIKVRKVMQLSIAFDHRICDGGEAAGFLRFVADCVESPTKLLASL